jgi:hypothetical protein
VADAIIGIKITLTRNTGRECCRAEWMRACRAELGGFIKVCAARITTIQTIEAPLDDLPFQNNCQITPVFASYRIIGCDGGGSDYHGCGNYSGSLAMPRSRTTHSACIVCPCGLYHSALQLLTPETLPYRPWWAKSAA